MAQTSVKMKRTELHELVWKEPLSRLAPRLGLSDVGLAKICDRLAVPRPPVGHWTRIQHREVLTPALGPAKVGTPEEVEIRAKPEASRRRSSADVPNVVVGHRLSSPHSITCEIRDALAHAEVDRDGLLAGGRALGATFRVGPATRARALRIVDGAIKALERRGHSVEWISQSGRKELCGVLQGQRVSLRLREKLTQVVHQPSPWEVERIRRGDSYWGVKHDLVPSGQLRLEADTYLTDGLQKTWSDTKKKRLENRLGEFVVGLEAIAEVHRKIRKQHEEEERLRVERRLRAAEEARRVELEMKREKRLHSLVHSWRGAAEIRGFLDALELVSLPSAECAEVVQWGRAIAGRLDPLSDPIASVKSLASGGAA